MGRAMSVRYITTVDGIGAGELRGFFEGWPNPPTPEAHLGMLRGSGHVVLAVDEVSGDVVGFINAVGDGSHFAFIPLLEVLPGWRGRGVGSELVRRMLAELEGYYAIDLRCDEALQSYYERLGFSRAVGMMRRDYARQGGGAGGE